MSEEDQARSAELAEQIEAEEQMWVRMGFHPGMIIIDARLIQFKVNTLVEAVKELGFDPDRLDVIFKEKVLAQMKADRALLTQKKAEEARPDIAVARKPPLLGPNGQPII